MASIPGYGRFARYFFAILILAACTAPTHVATDYDHGTAFSSLRSFTLIERPHAGIKNPLIVQRTYEAIREQLASKGFTYVSDPASADLAVDFTVGARDRWDVRSFSAPAGPWFGPGSWVREIGVQQYRESTVVIDVFGVSSHRLVWRARAEKALSQSDGNRSELLIRETVAALLSNFPPHEVAVGSSDAAQSGPNGDGSLTTPTARIATLTAP
jgi:hypothetical protein